MRGIQIDTMILGAPGNRGASFPPAGRTYSPPAKQAVVCLRHRALCEADAAAAAASRQCHSTCGCCCHRLRSWKIPSL